MDTTIWLMVQLKYSKRFDDYFWIWYVSYKYMVYESIDMTDARSWLMLFTIKSGNLFCTGPAIAYFPCDIRYWKAHQLRQEESYLWCRVVYNTIAWNCMILTLFHHSISEMKWTNDERMYRFTRLSLQRALLPKSSDVWCRLLSGASSGCRDSIVILFCRENYGF